MDKSKPERADGDVCPRCKARGKTWDGDDPVCAFRGGRPFDAANWMCATMIAIREHMGVRDAVVVDDGDQHCAVTPWRGCFVMVGWYKRRGRTEAAVLLSEADVLPMTLHDATEFLRDSTLTDDRP